MIRYRDCVSSLETIDAKQARQVQLWLGELGASLSDVFGADRILWVEGPTEEHCFPMLLEQVANVRLRGTVIQGVRNTGDFDGRHAELVIDLYSKVSQAGSLVPAAVGFLFDDEGRTDQQKLELQSRANGVPVKFTGRRMYENYVLNADAIAAVANSTEDFAGPAVTVEQVQEWIETNRGRFAPPDSAPNPSNGRSWIDEVHAGKLLKALFSEMSDRRVNYRKPEHSVALTRWLIANKPSELAEIAALVESVLQPVSQS